MLRAKGSLRGLALSMILLLLVYPFLTRGTSQRIVLNLLMTAIFFFGIRTVSDSRKHLVLAWSLAVPWFMVTWLEMVASDPGAVLSGQAKALYLFPTKAQRALKYLQMIEIVLIKERDTKKGTPLSGKS